MNFLKKNSVSLVVSDIKMPKMDGIDMCREIKKINEMQPFIFLTAFKNTEYLMDAIDLQVNGYIPKPTNLLTLQRKIEELSIQILWKDMEKTRKQEIETIFETTLDGIAIIDFETNFLFCNSAFENITAYTKEELFKTSSYALTSKEYIEQSKKMIQTVIQKGSVKDFKISYRDKNQNKIYLNMSLSLMPEHERIIIASQDVTELEQKEQQLKNYINIVNENVLTSTTDLDGKIIYSSEAFCKLSGYTKEELVGATHHIVNHPDTPQKLFKDLWDTISQDRIWKGEIKNKKKDGSHYWISVTITPIFNLEHNKKIGYTAIHYDITDKKTIEHLSRIDPLTELYNRRYFDEVFLEYSNKLELKRMWFNFMIIDIDFFKQYNDAYGHPMGDIVLQKIASVLREFVDPHGYAFRLGGEEFGVLYGADSADEGIKKAQNIVRKIEALGIKHIYNEASQNVTVSAGSIVSCKHLPDISTSYKRADQNLYDAKRNGKNQVITSMEE